MRHNSLRIRKAVPADKSAVLEFCRHTWPGGDYIPEVWDDWVRDKKGQLAVAVIGRKPVGVAHATFQTKNVVWLEGVRVHPNYRGLGIAGKLNLHLTRFAAGNGARVARLCTGSKNKASRRHLEKVGFEKLQAFQRLETVSKLKNPPSIVYQPRKLMANVWAWVRNRPEFDLFKGMYADGWTWYPLTASSFRGFMNQQRVLVTGSNPCASCSIFSTEEHRLTLGFAAGSSTEVGHHARYLRYLLWKEKGEKARALVPERSRFVKVLEDVGYEKSGRILVFEKPLPN